MNRLTGLEFGFVLVLLTTFGALASFVLWVAGVGRKK